MASHTKMETFPTSEYDDDAVSYDSASDTDDGYLGGSATYRPPNDHDRAVLLQEEEQERLLANSKAGVAGVHKQSLKSKLEDRLSTKISRRETRRQNGKSRRRDGNRKRKDGEMMYEMEEGAKDLSSSSSTTSFELYGKEWAIDEKQPQKSVRPRLLVLYVMVAFVFVLLAFGAYKASSEHQQSRHTMAATL